MPKPLSLLHCRGSAGALVPRSDAGSLNTAHLTTGSCPWISCRGSATGVGILKICAGARENSGVPGTGAVSLETGGSGDRLGDRHLDVRDRCRGLIVGFPLRDPVDKDNAGDLLSRGIGGTGMAKRSFIAWKASGVVGTIRC